MEKVSVLIADDHNIIHLGLSALIKRIRPNAAIHSAVDFPSAIDLVKKHSFDLVIMDISMPGGNFQATLELMKKMKPEVKIIAFSSADEAVYAPRFLVQGADGFLNKLSTENQIEQAIESMLKRGVYVSAEVKEIFIENTLKAGKAFQNPLNVLTNREIEVAKLLIQGDSLKGIHEKLFIHVSTISTYKTRIYRKLSVNSIPELIEVFNMYPS